MSYGYITVHRYQAHIKHGVKSLESGIRQYEYEDDKIVDVVPRWDDKQNRILVEEIGEISKAMNEFALGNLTWTDYEDNLLGEITDSIVVLQAWYDKLVGIKLQDRINDWESDAGVSISETLS